MSDNPMTDERHHVSHGALYLYRNAAGTWGWPDVLTTSTGKHLHLDPEEADDIAEVLEDARSAVSLAEYLKAVLLDGLAPTGPAPSGLEPGEIVAVPADLQSLADEIERHAAMVPPEHLRGQWENGRQAALRSVLAWIANGTPDGTACVDARPIQNGDPR